MADTPTIIPAQRRTLAMVMDETCERLTECPPIPADATRQTLTGGFIAIAGGMEGPQERWRMDASGAVREYTRFKAMDDTVRGKCSWSAVWWAE